LIFSLISALLFAVILADPPRSLLEIEACYFLMQINKPKLRLNPVSMCSFLQSSSQTALASKSANNSGAEESSRPIREYPPVIFHRGASQVYEVTPRFNFGTMFVWPAKLRRSLRVSDAIQSMTVGDAGADCWSLQGLATVQKIGRGHEQHELSASASGALPAVGSALL
jgi:hypothetical protein